MPSQTRLASTALPLVLVGIVVLASMGSGIVLADETPSIEDIDPADVEPADEIYLTDSGEAVLVYTEGSDDAVTEAEFGADISAGLVDALVSTEADEDVTGEIGMILEPDRFSGSGDLMIDHPEDLGMGYLQASGERTAENSQFDAEAEITLQDEQEAYPGFVTTGEFTVAPDQFELDAAFETTDGALTASEEEHDSSYALNITQTGEDFLVEVTQEQPVAVEEAHKWNTEENATETLEAQTNETAQMLGGDATVEIVDYAYEDGEDIDRLKVAYTTTMTGVIDGMVTTIEEDLAEDPTLDLSEEEAATIAEHLRDITLDELTIVYEQHASAVEASGSLSVSGYEEAFLAYLDEADSEQTLGDLQHVLEAQSEADLRQTVSWQASLENGDETAVFEAVLSYDTENWEAYIDATDERGLEHDTAYAFDLEAETDGHATDITADVTVNREDLIDDVVDELTGGSDETERDDTMLAFVRSLENSEVEVAKGDLLFGEDTVDMRLAAQVDGLEEANPLPDTLSDQASLTEVFSEHEDETAITYATIDIGDATTSDLSSAGLADHGTVIHEPGAWDPDDLPAYDAADTAAYLGVEYEDEFDSSDESSENDDDDDARTDTGDDTDRSDADPEPSDDFLPGFGIVLAMLGLLVAAGWRVSQGPRFDG